MGKKQSNKRKKIKKVICYTAVELQLWSPPTVFSPLFSPFHNKIFKEKLKKNSKS